MNAILPLFVRWDVNPTMISIGSFEIRYYGLLWAIALGISAYIFHNIMQREGLSEKAFDSIFWFGVISTVVGARLGHCLFYDPGYYLTHPIEILDIRQGGLASHGAAFGLLLGLWLFSRKNKMPYIWSLDRISIAVAISGVAVRVRSCGGASDPDLRSALLPGAVHYPVVDVLQKRHRPPASRPDVWILPDRAVRDTVPDRIHQESAGRLRSEYAPEYGTAVKYSVYPDRYRDPLVRIAQTSARSRTAEKEFFRHPCETKIEPP